MGEVENVFDYVRSRVGRPPDNLRVCGAVNLRLGSDRLPNKGILPLACEPAWWHCMKRIEKAAELSGIDLVGCAVITSGHPENDILEEQARRYGYDCIRHEPEEDLPGRRLKAMDFYNCDFMLNLGADTPLAVVEHVPLIWEVAKQYNIWASYVWRNHARSGDPRHSVGEVVCAVALSTRWYNIRTRMLAPTLQELQDYTIEIRMPELTRTLPIPRQSWIEMPDWFWDYWRWYVLEIDNIEDAVMLMLLYDRFYSSGQIVSWKDCIDWIDADYQTTGGKHHYNAGRKHSAVNQYAYTELDRQNEQYFLQFCESYLAPEKATKLYCYLCGEYLGYVQKRNGLDHLHRPDGSIVTGTARVTCSSGHFRMWEHTLQRTIAAGSAVATPEMAIEYGGG